MARMRVTPVCKPSAKPIRVQPNGGAFAEINGFFATNVTRLIHPLSLSPSRGKVRRFREIPRAPRRYISACFSFPCFGRDGRLFVRVLGPSRRLEPARREIQLCHSSAPSGFFSCPLFPSFFPWARPQKPSARYPSAVG